MKVLTTGDESHPAYLSVNALQRAMVARGSVFKSNGTYLERFVSRVLVRFNQQRVILPLVPRQYFGVVMNLPARWIYPQALWSRGIVYCFDCWEPRWDEWEQFLRNNAFDVVFISARDSATEMARRLPDRKILWMPEGVDPAPYRPDRTLAERSTDLLEFGRHTRQFNDVVARHCRQRGYNHRYRVGDAWLFPTQAELYAGLADAKLVVCVPQSVTNPEIAGSVETMTMRYLEVMASGALVIGRCPAELIDLFGYNPVIEVDEASAGEQLDTILGGIAAYEPLRERNLKRLHEVGTWDARADDIVNSLRSIL